MNSLEMTLQTVFLIVAFVTNGTCKRLPGCGVPTLMINPMFAMSESTSTDRARERFDAKVTVYVPFHLRNFGKLRLCRRIYI